MESLSVNKLFKEYKNSGGTMSFKDFVDKHNRKKNAIGDESVSNMFHNAIGQDVMDMFGEKPVKEEAKVVSFKGVDGGVSTGAVNPADNMTFGINNYVIIGTAVIIVGAIGLNYYLKHKK
jgi:hypothetical protein